MAEMVAVLVSIPGNVGWNVTPTVAEPPLVRVPRAHTMAVPLLTQVPCEVEEETKSAFAGSGLVIVTPVAVAGPWFVAVIVKVMLLPTTTGLGAADICNATSTELLSMQQTDCIVERLSDHAAMLPGLVRPLAWSSYTKSCQVPFGLVP